MTKPKQPHRATRAKPGGTGDTPSRAKATAKTRARGGFSPAHARYILNLVNGQVSEVTHEMTAQIKRMYRLMAELEMLRTSVTRLLTPVIKSNSPRAIKRAVV